MKKYCFECEKETDFEIIVKDETFRYRGREHVIPTQYYKCQKCGWLFTDSTLPDPLEELYRKAGR